MTKTFTSLAAVLLARSGALDLDSPVSRWLPDLRLPQGVERSVTCRHLLSHTSGLPGLPFIHGARTQSILNDPDRDMLLDRAPVTERWAWVREVPDLVTALSSYEYSRLGRPGEVFNYSNESFGLMQGVIEGASGRSYRDVLVEEVFAPLGIDRFSLTAEDLAATDNVVELFAPLRHTALPYSPSPAWWDVGGFYSNGSLKISSSALLGVIEAIGRPHRDPAGDGTQCPLLPGFGIEGRTMLTETHAELPDGGRYGLGVDLSPDGPGPRWFGHGGSIKGASTQFRTYPELGLTVVCLINATNAPVTRFVDTIVSEVLGTPTGSGTITPVECADTGRPERLGHYASEELNELDVSERNGQLFVQKNGSPPTALTKVGPDTFHSPDGFPCVFVRGTA